MTKISSLDRGYVSGDLSLFPEIIDDKDSLYEVRNNAEAQLKQSLLFGSKHIIVSDASGFPPSGLLRIGPRTGAGNSELVYYGSRTNSTFTELVRGFAGSIQSKWSAGLWVSNAVMAEHHNAVKDAILKIEEKLGVETASDDESLAGRVRQLEVRYLAPKAVFRAFPRKGSPSLTVRFQNFSTGASVRYLWDFGDRTTSIEESPTHTYSQEGIYTVTLNVITETGAQGIATKKNYITVSEDEKIPFFYTTQVDKTKPAYSQETADKLVETSEDLEAEAAEFLFVDQTDGDIIQRFWVFDDGSTMSEIDPNSHTIRHTYEKSGEYRPTLLVVFDNERLERVFLKETITVL